VDEEDAPDASREFANDSFLMRDARTEEERELHAQKTKTIRDALLVVLRRLSTAALTSV
jgi:hypothetical protein